MNLTSKLLARLNRVFNRDPQPVLALRIRYLGGGMTWQVSDGWLYLHADTTTSTLTSAAISDSEVATDAAVDGDALLVDAAVSAIGADSSPSIDLSEYTVQTLAQHIATIPGFVVEYLDDTGAVSGLSARVLIDASGDQDQSNGDHLYAYTSLLWAWLEAVGSELTSARAVVQAAPSQMVVQTSSGMWLDQLGGLYSVDRNAGEVDADYSPRILSSIGRPAGNNVALEMAINTVTGGLRAKVVDADAQAYTSGGGGTSYGLFTVVYDIDLEGSDALTAYTSRVLDVVGRLRDAGTHLSSISVNGTLSDTYDTSNVAVDTLSTLALTVDDMTDSAAFSIKRHNGKYRRDGSYTNPYDGSIQYDGTQLYGWNPGPLVTFDAGVEALQITLVIGGVTQPPEDI